MLLLNCCNRWWNNWLDKSADRLLLLWRASTHRRESVHHWQGPVWLDHLGRSLVSRVHKSVNYFLGVGNGGIFVHVEGIRERGEYVELRRQQHLHHGRISNL